MILLLIGYALTGLAAGLLGGLLGIGGGAVTVPSLNLILGETMHVAIAASLVSMMFISISSVHGHWKSGYVLKPVVVRMVPLATVSAIAGVIIGGIFPGWILRRIFAVFLVYTAGNMIYKLVKHNIVMHPEEEPVAEFKMPNEWVTPLVAIPMGLSCGVLGIGGGMVAVPALHLFLRLPLKNAIANSAATIFFSASIAAIVKLVSIHGMTVTRASGEVLTLSWHHAAVIGLLVAPTAFVAGRIGSHLTRKCPTSVIRVIFTLAVLWGAYKFWTNSEPSAAPNASAPAVTAPAEPAAPSAAEGPRPVPSAIAGNPSSPPGVFE